MKKLISLIVIFFIGVVTINGYVFYLNFTNYLNSDKRECTCVIDTTQTNNEYQYNTHQYKTHYIFNGKFYQHVYY